MNAVENAMIRCRTIRNTVTELSIKAKKSGKGFPGFDDGGGFGGMSQSGGNRQQYAVFRGWVHSAIHALAIEAAQQQVFAGELASKAKKPGKDKPKPSKLHLPEHLQRKVYKKELESDPDHELLPALESPNNMQSRFDFVYSFVANLCLTGWAYVAVGKGDKEHPVQFYSLPTTWVTPIHDKGAYQEFKIANPNNPAAGEAPNLSREQVEFAHFSNPADPLAALSLTQAQAWAIKIDDRIQSSQSMFFDNGIFPATVVTVGSQPHPEFPAGVRPLLTKEQREEIYAAIAGSMGGVANYGRPAIVDGLIENITRLSATANEMGWEKSEKAVRTRILSAFGVHPIILGEEVASSYAQAYIVRDLFCRRVNVFLEMLSNAMTKLCKTVMGSEDLVVWWDDAKAKDPQMEQSLWLAARANDDVSQDELREYMSLSPDADGEESMISKGMMPHIISVATAVAKGGMSPEQAQAILVGSGLPQDLAAGIAGDGKIVDPMQEALMQQQLAMGGPPAKPGQPGVQGGKPPAKPGEKPPITPPKPSAKPKPTEPVAVEAAAKALGDAVAALRKVPSAESVLAGL